MADFCSICVSFLYEKEFKSEIGDVLFFERILSGGDIDIEGIYLDEIKPKIEEYLANEFCGLNIGGVCEHCGLVRLSIKKEDDVTYLVALCYKNNNTGKYKIAVVKDDGQLVFQEEEVRKLYNED